MKMSRIFACFAIAACMLGQFAHAQTTIGTWNLAWLFDKPTHERWVDACAKIGWKSEEDLKAEGKQLPEELRGLPYCDVHNGIEFKIAKRCREEIGSPLLKRPNAIDSSDGKCRTSPDLADWTAYELKLKALRETWASLDKKGVTLIGLQEVTSEAAVKQILPPGWEVKTSASETGAPNIPQHVGVAWKVGSATPKNFKLVSELSQASNRPLRPGLWFQVAIAGAPVDMLVVHLKAGCRSKAINSKNEADCAVMAKQSPIVESWIDTRVGKDFVVLGDFNRSLLKELKEFPNPDPAKFGSTPVDQIQWLAPEWNDNQPSGSTILVLPHLEKADGTLVAGDYFCKETPGIDHVILSATLAKRLKALERKVVVTPVGYLLNGTRLPIAKTTVPPSDHCARIAKFSQ